MFKVKNSFIVVVVVWQVNQNIKTLKSFLIYFTGSLVELSRTCSCQRLKYSVVGCDCKVRLLSKPGTFHCQLNLLIMSQISWFVILIEDLEKDLTGTSLTEIMAIKCLSI